MTVEEYIKELKKVKEAAVGRFSSLSALERAVVEGSYEWLVNKLEIKQGEVTVDADLIAAMDSFVHAVNDIVNSDAFFKGRVSSFLTDLNTLLSNTQKFHATTNDFNIKTAGVTAVQEAVVDEALNQFSANGLNAGFVVPLRDNVFRNILAGASMKDVKKVLQDYIQSGKDTTGKLKSYLNNTAIQAVDTYQGAINQKIATEFSFTGYIISGSLIETSSKQCVLAVTESLKDGGYLPFSEWTKVLTVARLNPKARLIPGTTIENLPLNKLHWGCRHDFTPMIM